MFLACACKVGSSDQAAINEPKAIKDPAATLESLASTFPASKIDELVTSISQEELATVITDGESKEWTSTSPSVDGHELVVRNKLAPDNLIRFVLYQGNPVVAMIGVQQENAQVTTTEVWEYKFNAGDDRPDERWNQYLLPDYKYESFFDERVLLPEQFRGKSAKPYLDCKFGQSAITISFNKWSFIRELEVDSVSPAGALDPALIKYRYLLNWNGTRFIEDKVKETGYSGELIFPGSIVEETKDGPGIHEFDCPHGVTVKTSSILPKQGIYNYKPSNMLDSARATAWGEGAEGNGEGEWIEFTITSNYLIGNSWQILNGYGRNKEVWAANNRIKKMKVLVDDQLIGYVMLANVSAFQEFNIAPFWLKDAPSFRKGTRIRFVIEEVYKGTKYSDTLISYFVPTGNCG